MAQRSIALQSDDEEPTSDFSILDIGARVEEYLSVAQFPLITRRQLKKPSNSQLPRLNYCPSVKTVQLKDVFALPSLSTGLWNAF